jgi:hypothetical protein
MFSLSSCIEEFYNMRRDMEKMTDELKGLRGDVERLRVEVTDGFSLALCTPELRQLLESVRMECGSQSANSLPGQCNTTQVRGSVMKADPEHKGRFLKFMSHLPHEVLYIGEGVKDLPSHRLLRFNGLARRAILTNTVFLVVSSPESGQGEAERRAALVEQLLLDRKVPPAKIWRWVYTFPATKVDIEKKADLPGIGEDQQLNHGVWIFRADC